MSDSGVLMRLHIPLSPLPLPSYPFYALATPGTDTYKVAKRAAPNSAIGCSCQPRRVSRTHLRTRYCPCRVIPVKHVVHEYRYLVLSDQQGLKLSATVLNPQLFRVHPIVRASKRAVLTGDVRTYQRRENSVELRNRNNLANRFSDVHAPSPLLFN